MRTRVGYCGGLQARPTYQRLGDHTETIEIDFDPNRISYTQLLEVFWHSHNPSRRPWSRQYMSAIFFHDAAQKALAEQSKSASELDLNKTIHTLIVPLTQFHRAELYHQKYQLRRQQEVFREFEAMYPNPWHVVDSTSAARTNGYLGGHGTLRKLEGELPLLGLSDQSQQKLWRIIDKSEKRRRQS